MVRISRSHRDGRGSIPRLGMFSHFFYYKKKEYHDKAVALNFTLYWKACDVATQLMRDTMVKERKEKRGKEGAILSIDLPPISFGRIFHDEIKEWSLHVFYKEKL